MPKGENLTSAKAAELGAMGRGKTKTKPDEWITEDGHDVTDEAIEYCLPLIQGEQNLHMKNGLPIQFILKDKL